MKRSLKTCLMGALLICGLGLCLPKVSYAVAGCTNAYLSGTYTAAVQSANFLNVLNSINTAASQANGTGSGTSGTGGSTGSAGSGSSGSGSGSIAQQPGTGSGSGGSTGSTGSSGGSTGAVGSTTPSFGFVNTPFSLGGATPGTSRFYFDGNGNIVGTNPGSSAANVIVGSYSVNSDCTASMNLNTGETFNAVVVNAGDQVLFMQSNASMGGAVGSLQRSSSVCLASSPTPQSFGFSFFGAQQVNSTSSTSSSGGTGSTTGSTATANAVSFSPYGAIGELSLNGAGGFTMTEWIYQNGSTSKATASGNYSVGADCSLSLSFAAPNLTAVANGGSTGAVGSGATISPITAPVSFRGALVNSSSGVLVIQPNSLTTISGTFVSQ